MAKRKGVTLTKRVVDAADRRASRYHIWDDELAGFAVRVEPSGSKTFVIKYRADGGGRSARQRWLVIGRYGALTTDQARKIAKAKLGGVAAGADPAGELAAKRREMTMTALIDLYEKDGCVVQRGIRQGEPMKPVTKRNTINRLRNHVIPLLGTRQAPTINPGDIERFVADVTCGKTARDEKVGPRKRIIVRGGAGGARKVVRDLSAVFSFALRSEIVKRNPCQTAAVRKTDNRRERFLTFEEVTRLGNALDDLEADGANPKAINIARLWALTGCRRDEIAGLRWSEVNIDDGLLVLADSKTGKSLRPLGRAAVALLKSIDRSEDSDFVFPAERGEGHYQGTKSVWAKAIAKANLPGVTPHTLRHTMGSTATSTGEALALTGAILGHANPRSTAIYAHVQMDPARQAAERVSAKIAGALAERSKDGQTPQQASEEIEMLVRSLVERLGQQGVGVSQINALVGQLEGTPLSGKAVA